MQRAYFDLTTHQQEEALGLMVKWVLHARHRLGAPSNTPAFDEDVNIYLAHLLLAAIDPRYRTLCDQYVAPHDLDVFQHANRTDLPQLKSLIYRLNADHWLLVLGIFQPVRTGGDSPSPSTDAMPRAVYEGYGSTYYQFAAAYARQHTTRPGGASDVLNKLADDFGKYTLVLTEVRQDYFHFLEAVSSRQFTQLLKDVNDDERETRLRQLRDAFLDAYSRWRQSPTAEHQQHLTASASALQQMDPTFHYAPSIGTAPPVDEHPPVA